MTAFIVVLLPNTEMLTISVTATDTIADVKERIASEGQLSINLFDLMYEGVMATDSVIAEIAASGGEVEAVLSIKGRALLLLGAEPTAVMMIDFVRTGNKEGVKNCVDAGFDPNTQLRNGRTALYLACETGSFEICEYLMSLPTIDPTIKSAAGYTPIHIACRSRYRKISKLLIRQSAGMDQEYTRSSMFVCCTLGEVELVTELLEHGGVDLSSFFAHNDPMVAAAIYGRVEVVKLLLNRAESITHRRCNGETVLTAVCKGDNVEVVDVVLNKCEKLINIPNAQLSTPLHVAARNGNIEIVTRLMAVKGCKLNAVDSQHQRPLNIACTHRFNDIAKLLLSVQKTNVNSRDSNGHTPLYNASKNGDLDLVRVITSHPKVKVNSGKSALEAALRNNHFDVAEHLREYDFDDFV
eukprot:TRINITY_DN450_c1_g1_i1.p1 TRINITY_DN450_c1_g1~~TRINITY_DN450_c1_g1_i1.p1  ORF type:complete len:411 (+),score=73.30 TRINITY_DN450_c1_g1_i1:73-1305(+)